MRGAGSVERDVIRRAHKLDGDLLSRFERAGANAQHAATLLRDLLADYPDRAALAEDIVDCEHRGDEISHDILHRLAAQASRSVDAFLASEIHRLVGALDDIVDHAEECADRLGLYGIEAPLEAAYALADVLVRAATQVATATGDWRHARLNGETLVEIRRLENDGDRLHRAAVASLFAAGIDPMVVIRWKDILQSLESAIDACETVANTLDGITLHRD